MEAFIWVAVVIIGISLLGSFIDEFIMPLLEKLAYAVGYIVGILLIPAVVLGIIFALGAIF